MRENPFRFNIDLIDEIDKEFDQKEAMLLNIFEAIDETNIQNFYSSFYHYYHNTMVSQYAMASNGRPHVKEFENVGSRGIIERDEIKSPFVDMIIDDKGFLRITVEMLGVSNDDIVINVSNQFISIHAENEEKNYNLKVPIYHELDPKSSKASYINDILEIKIKLKQITKNKTVQISID